MRVWRVGECMMRSVDFLKWAVAMSKEINYDGYRRTYVDNYGGNWMGSLAGEKEFFFQWRAK